MSVTFDWPQNKHPCLLCINKNQVRRQTKHNFVLNILSSHTYAPNNAPSLLSVSSIPLHLFQLSYHAICILSPITCFISSQMHNISIWTPIYYGPLHDQIMIMNETMQITSAVSLDNLPQLIASVNWMLYVTYISSLDLNNNPEAQAL